jgi:hypothetical protein
MVVNAGSVPTPTPAFSHFPSMIPLLVILEELVHTDFGTMDLNSVRQRLAAQSPAPTVAGQACAFLDALAVVQHRPREEVYVWAGQRVVGPLVAEFPAIFKGHTSTRTLLLQLGQVAPALVADVLPESVCPDFWEDFLDSETIRIGFDGPEEAAWALQGIAAGLGTHFGERVDASRGVAPAALTDRRLVDVKVVPERRGGGRGGRPVFGLSSAATRS